MKSLNASCRTESKEDLSIGAYVEVNSAASVLSLALQGLHGTGRWGLEAALPSSHAWWRKQQEEVTGGEEEEDKKADEEDEMKCVILKIVSI